MKVQDSLSFADASKMFLNDKNIEDLVHTFYNGGVKIDSLNSEKEVIYKVFGKEKTSVVPLNTNFKNGVDTKAYFLRNKNLEISLKNYTSVTDKNLDHGQNSYVETGIACDFLFEGDSKEGIFLIDRAKEILRRFYSISQ